MERNTWNQFFMAPCHLLALWSTCTRTFLGTTVVQENSVREDGDNGSTSDKDPCIDEKCPGVSSHSVHAIHATGVALLLFPIAAMTVVAAILFNRRRQANSEMRVRREQNPHSVRIEKNPPDDFFIQIPFVAEEVTGVNDAVQQVASTTESTERLVNINTANESALLTIPGIGPAKAIAIITYREAYGLFNTPESLMAISGIGEKSFEKLAHFITID